MKKIILGLNLVLLLSAFCLAQDSDTKTEGKPLKRSSSTNTKGISAKGSGSPNLQAGINLQAQLEQTLDVKKARVGDQVVMKVTKSVKQNGRTVVEKGSRLIGRITEVQQKTRDNAISRLGVVFERIQGQDLDSPISASIVSFSQVAANAGVDDMFETGVSGGASSSGTVSSGGSTSGGGGLLGGAAGGVLGTTANTVGTVTNTARQTVGTAANTAGNTVRNTTQTAGRTVNGINISQSAGTSAQGGTTLSAANKNLRLEKGAAFQLQVNGSAGSN